MDPYPQFKILVNRCSVADIGSEFFPSRVRIQIFSIPDPYLYPKKLFLSSRKYDQAGCVDPGSESQIQTFYPTRIPAPVVKKAPDLISLYATLTDCQSFFILCFRFHKIYSPEEALSQILERDDIFIYETPDPQDKNQVSDLVVQLLWI
jgi:hypothetical protein